MNQKLQSLRAGFDEMCRDHPARAVMRTKKITKILHHVSRACRLPIKVKHLRYNLRKALVLQMAPFRKIIRRENPLTIPPQECLGKRMEFQKWHYSIWRATFVFQFISGIIQFETWNHSKRNLTKLFHRNSRKKLHQHWLQPIHLEAYYEVMNYKHENWVNRTSSAS